MNENTGLILAIVSSILGFVLTDVDLLFAVIMKGFGIVLLALTIVLQIKKYFVYSSTKKQEMEAKKQEMEAKKKEMEAKDLEIEKSKIELEQLRAKNKLES